MFGGFGKMMQQANPFADIAGRFQQPGAGSGSPSAAPGPSPEQALQQTAQALPGGPSRIEAYIRQAAAQRGMDPDIAVRVAKAEGGLREPALQSGFMRNGRREPSYGPYQLLIGGGDTGFPEGLGNRALAAGIDPRDPAQWQRGVDFALDTAAREGWGQWYGAAKVGVGERDGLPGAGVGVPQGASPTGPQQATVDAGASSVNGGSEVPEGTQRLPEAPSRARAGAPAPDAGFQSVEEQAPAALTPVGQAYEQWKVNRSTRRLRGLGPAATLGVLAAIGAELRGSIRQTQEQPRARD